MNRNLPEPSRADRLDTRNPTYGLRGQDKHGKTDLLGVNAVQTPLSQNETRPLVLCVDDEPHLLQAMRDILRRRFEVHLASGGAAGLRLLGAAPDAFAIVISDMRMPVMAGDSFLREARMVAPNAVRMLLTGHADVEAAVRAVNHAQLFRFLTKPCPPDELLQACAAALRHHRLLTAERVLLEQTLRGSVEALAGILALVDPAAFGRSSRVKEVAAKLSRAIELKNGWEVEVAALLAPLGAVTLPRETAERLYTGASLTPEEREMVDRVPAVTRRLVANIERLDGVLSILDSYLQTPAAGDVEALERIPAGARVLRIATDYVELTTTGGDDRQSALTEMRSRKIYDQGLLDELEAAIGVGVKAVRPREVGIAQLEVGMRIADDVRDARGELVIARGEVVSEPLLERLANLDDELVRKPLRVGGAG